VASFAEGVVDEDETGGRVGPPPPQDDVEDKTEKDKTEANTPSTKVTRPSVRSTGLSRALPVRALPDARENMTPAVTAVHAVPTGLW
jgi:hypothetical protein